MLFQPSTTLRWNMASSASASPFLNFPIVSELVTPRLFFRSLKTLTLFNSPLLLVSLVDLSMTTRVLRRFFPSSWVAPAFAPLLKFAQRPLLPQQNNRPALWQKLCHLTFRHVALKALSLYYSLKPATQLTPPLTSFLLRPLSIHFRPKSMPIITLNFFLLPTFVTRLVFIHSPSLTPVTGWTLSPRHPTTSTWTLESLDRRWVTVLAFPSCRLRTVARTTATSSKTNSVTMPYIAATTMA